MNPIGIAYSLGLASGVIGTLGATVELAINKKKEDLDSTNQKVFNVFLKTVEAICAWVALVALASVSLPTLGGAVIALIGTVMICTPLLNHLIQQTEYDPLKKGMHCVDKIVNIASKLINVSALAFGASVVIDQALLKLSGESIRLFSAGGVAACLTGLFFFSLAKEA